MMSLHKSRMSDRLSGVAALAIGLALVSQLSVQAAGPLDLIPADATAVVRLKSPEATIGKVGNFANAVQPGLGFMVQGQAPGLGALISNPTLGGVDLKQDWYVAVFDLEELPRGSIQSTTNVPGMNLSFGNTQNEHAPTDGRAIDHIGFELDDLEAFCETLKAKGIEFDVEYRDIPSIGLKIAFLTDPAGTFIELTEGYDDF